MQNLLDAIVANPDDDGVRLVYADALTSAGDPRGEFIVVQIELAKLLGESSRAQREETTAAAALEASPNIIPDAAIARAGVLWRRERELLTAHKQAWSEALFGDDMTGGGFVADVSYRRGFVHSMTVGGDGRRAPSSKFAERMRVGPPIEAIHFGVWTNDEQISRLCDDAHAGVIEHLRTLSIERASMNGSQIFERLVHAAPRLERLALSEQLILERVTGASCLRSLRSLELSHGGLKALDFLDVAICPNLERVAIGFARNANANDAPEPFQVPPGFKTREPLSKLKELQIDGDDEGIALRAILQSKIASTLEGIEIRRAKTISSALLTTLTASRSLAKLDFGIAKVRSLRSLLRSSRSSNKGFEKVHIDFLSSIDEPALIAFLEQNPTLRVLSLGRPDFVHATGDDRFDALEDAPDLEGLDGKELYEASIAVRRPRPVPDVAAPPTIPIHKATLLDVLAKHAPASLRCLALSRWDLSDSDWLKAFISAPKLSNLRALYLQSGEMSDEGACIVSNAPMLSLVVLNLAHNKIGEAGKTALREAQRERFPGLLDLTL